jgi:hypothetical protein
VAPINPIPPNEWKCRRQNLTRSRKWRWLDVPRGQCDEAYGRGAAERSTAPEPVLFPQPATGSTNSDAWHTTVVLSSRSVGSWSAIDRTGHYAVMWHK